jgi:hypothetical protein
MKGRKPDPKAATPGGSSLLRIGVAVVVVVGLVLIGAHSTNFIMGRALLVAFGGAETTYRGARPTLFGDVVASDVLVYLSDGDPANAMRFERAVVETPGLFWLLRSTYHRKLSLPFADDMALELTGGISPEGIDFTLGEGGFGGATASVFEAQGCAADDHWVPAEVADMGLDAGPATVRFQWTAEDRVLTTVQTVDIGGVSSARHERRERMKAATTNVLILEFAGDSQVLSEHWKVEDRGFVRARNEWCARKDKVPVETFVARHVASVQRLMESQGLAASPEMVDVYRAFARRGGTITLGGDYTRWVSYNSEYTEESWGDTLARLGGELVVDGRSAPLAWSRVAERELPGADDLTTFEVLVLEGRAPGVAPSRDAPAAADRVAVAAPIASPAPATPGPAAAARADSAPANANADAAGYWERAAPEDAIPFGDMRRHLGRQLVVTLANGRTIRATVTAVEPERVVLEVLLGGGKASYSVRREDLVLARIP